MQNNYKFKNSVFKNRIVFWKSFSVVFRNNTFYQGLECYLETSILTKFKS